MTAPPRFCVTNEKPLGVSSRKLAQIPYLEVLLGAQLTRSQLGRFWHPLTAVAGWGHKQTATRARRYAKQLGVPYLAVEDGFIRSVGLGENDAPLSLVTDDLGIYYNANQPSRFEALAQERLDSHAQLRGERLIALWRQHRISKYNHLREYAGNLPARYVLVIDQTWGDASVSLGQASAESFSQMLNSALAQHPECQVLLKTHPEVQAGHKKGYLSASHNTSVYPSSPKHTSVHARIQIIDDAVHPVRLIEHAQAVYTVTSQVGFEALLWGKKVFTFGMPFYAGWGLTTDTLVAPARRGRLTLEQLAHAALIDYPRYLHPETHEHAQAEQVIEWLGFQRALRSRFASKIYALEFSYNKRSSVKKFLSGSEVVFVKHEQDLAPAATVAVWGSRLVKRADVAIIRLEDGFIRSVGLGADLIKPTSWVADASGIYYDATQPSDLETLLLSVQPDHATLERARQLRTSIVQAGLSKYNLRGEHWHRPPHTEQVILVPGQVETDASLRFGALSIKSNIELLKAVRGANPKAYLLYKPHPDVVAKLRRQGTGEDAASAYCDQIISHASIHELLNAVDEVHVMTSLTGFEALLRQRKVVTYGMPFYAGWGLTQDQVQHPSRTRQLTLDQLVAGVLIEYARYQRNDIKGFASAEAAVSGLVKQGQTEVAFQTLKNGLRRFFALATRARE